VPGDPHNGFAACVPFGKFGYGMMAEIAKCPPKEHDEAGKANPFMLPDVVESLAQELLSAFETGQMISVLPSARPGFDLNTAYAVEAALKQLRESGGHRAVGRKVGYANKAVWRMLKLETLVWAHMYEDTVHHSGNNAATLNLSHPRSLKIEPEIVFGLKQPIISGGVDATAALECTEWLALGFEIIDCPFAGWRFQPSDFVASFGLHAALVVGEKWYLRPELISKLVEELPRFTVRMFKNGEFVEEGSGKNSLRSPALCLAELSGAVAQRFPGQPLSAGEIISSGTLTAGHATERGDHWTAEVQGLALPPLTLHLT
jgi:2-oxo-3-hexenedioate decarboxylase